MSSHLVWHCTPGSSRAKSRAVVAARARYTSNGAPPAPTLIAEIARLGSAPDKRDGFNPRP